MPKVTIRDWINRILLGGIYVIAMYYACGWATETPQFHAGMPCGGSTNKHWYWGGTPEHIVPVCLPVDAQGGKR